MNQTYTLTMEQMEALAALARRGMKTPDEERALEAFLKEIDEAAGIKRFLLWVLWRETDAELPPGTSFPRVWPPTQKTRLQVTGRPIAKADVDAALRLRAKKPVSIMVTTDPGGEVGFTAYEVYFNGSYVG